MGTTMEIWTAVFGLLGVTLGGLLTPLGGWALDARKEASEKKKKRAEKLEELVAALYEHKHWLDTVRKLRVFGGDAPEGMSPFAKIEGIVTVHFPSLLPKLAELEAASDDYELWMITAAQKRLAAKGKADIEGFDDAYKPYMQKLGGLLKAIREYAKSEFQ
jgi:hypothetical protein